jgi:hypothetical protein
MAPDILDDRLARIDFIPPDAFQTGILNGWPDDLLVFLLVQSVEGHRHETRLVTAPSCTSTLSVILTSRDVLQDVGRAPNVLRLTGVNRLRFSIALALHVRGGSRPVQPLCWTATRDFDTVSTIIQFPPGVIT